jgi:hypothetical protein
MAEIFGPSIVTNGLICCLDAGNYFSYTGAGSTWVDISGLNASGVRNGSISFGVSSFIFPASVGSNYFVGGPNTYLDFTMAIRPDFTLANDAGLVGLIGISSNAVNADKSLRCSGANGTGPWVIQNPDDANGWANPATTYYVNGVATNVLVNGWNIIGGYRTNQSAGFTTSFTYYLGTSGYNSVPNYREFKGFMAIVLLYNRQLSGAEQRQNFESLRGRFGI